MTIVLIIVIALLVALSLLVARGSLSIGTSLFMCCISMCAGLSLSGGFLIALNWSSLPWWQTSVAPEEIVLFLLLNLTFFISATTTLYLTGRIEKYFGPWGGTLASFASVTSLCGALFGVYAVHFGVISSTLGVGVMIATMLLSWVIVTRGVKHTRECVTLSLIES